MTKEEKIQKWNSTKGGFTGSQSFQRYLGNTLLTEGVLFLAQTLDCFWFLDVIASHQTNPKVRRESMQVWKLTVDLDNGTGLVVCEDGDYNKVIEQRIPSTDFPLAEIVVWAEENGSGKTILLPSEH